PFRTRARVTAADFRFLVGEELVSFYESTPGTHRGFCKVCGAPVLVKFDEHSRSAQTDPGAAALYGVALATLDDDPGVRPDAHAFMVDKAPWFTVTDDLPQYPAAYPWPERSARFLTGRSHAISVRGATLGVCWWFGEGPSPGSRGTGEMRRTRWSKPVSNSLGRTYEAGRVAVSTSDGRVRTAAPDRAGQCGGRAAETRRHADLSDPSRLVRGALRGPLAQPLRQEDATNQSAYPLPVWGVHDGKFTSHYSRTYVE